MVSTSVVEVGIDVPNATIMLVEAAYCFLGWRSRIEFRGRWAVVSSKAIACCCSEHPSEYTVRLFEGINENLGLAQNTPSRGFLQRQSGYET